MNQAQRKTLRKAIAELNVVKNEIEGHAEALEVKDPDAGDSKVLISIWADSLRDIQSDVTDEQEAEASKLENMPESLLDAGKGEQMEEAIGCLEEAADKIDNAFDQLEDEDTPVADRFEFAVSEIDDAIELIDNACNV